MRRMKILIAAGGSGGHIFPAVALARTLVRKRPDIEILFVGSNKALDRRIFEKEGVRFSLLSANKLPYKITPALVTFFMRLLLDGIKSFFIIGWYRPRVVVGFGGYVSCPVAVFSRLFRIPLLIHEQNVVPGRANRLAFRLADKVAVSFDETRKVLGPGERKAVFTGNPIRVEEFLTIAGENSRQDGIKKFGLDKSKFTILVIGGSQGAHFLNETFVKAVSKIDEQTRSNLQVIHITGVTDYKWALKAYGDLGLEHVVNSFLDRIEEAYSASDLVVTRSGASVIFELAFFGKPMILVPYPFANAHQAENAKVFSERGAAIAIDEDSLSPEIFKDNILNLFNDRDRLKTLASSARGLGVPTASDNLAKEVLEMAGDA